MMCRASSQGGRRCSGASSTSRSATAARQRISRARRALTTAEESGDPARINAAQARLDRATTATPTVPTAEHPVQPPAAEPPGMTPHVTDPAEADPPTPDTAGEVTVNKSGGGFVAQQVGFQIGHTNTSGPRPVGIQAGSVNGSTVFAMSGNGSTTSSTPDAATAPVDDGHQHQAPRGEARDVTVTNIATGNAHVGMQAGVVNGATTFTTSGNGFTMSHTPGPADPAGSHAPTEPGGNAQGRASRVTITGDGFRVVQTPEPTRDAATAQAAQHMADQARRIRDHAQRHAQSVRHTDRRGSNSSSGSTTGSTTNRDRSGFTGGGPHVVNRVTGNNNVVVTGGTLTAEDLAVLLRQSNVRVTPRSERTSEQ